MRIAVVSEGPSEAAIVEAVVQMLDPGAMVDPIWPDMTASGRPYGWRGVQSWCTEYGGDGLEVFMRGVVGREYDVLVVHLDCSMAHNLMIANPCPPAATTATQLDTRILSWLSRSQAGWIVTFTPSLTSDTWVAAALEPPYRPRVPLECDPEVENELVRRRLFRRKSGRIAKPQRAYRALVAEMALRWEHVKSQCTRAIAFEDALRVAFACVQDGRGPG